jgi:hypothetical protein
LAFLIAAMEREGRQKTDEPAGETEVESPEIISWGGAKKVAPEGRRPA